MSTSPESEFKPGPSCDYEGICGSSCLAAASIRSAIAERARGDNVNVQDAAQDFQCQHPEAQAARSEIASQ